MRFFSVLFSLLAITSTSVLAQSANIGAPVDMTEVSAGSNFTVMIDRPDTLTGSTEVALVIALLSCASNSCPGPSEELGTVLYDGSFDPQFTTEPGTGSLPPHENFTLTIPSTFTKGQAQLGVAHFFLLGASVAPVLETFNSTIVIT
ncbi:hypothetical protein EV368DRAFT_81911 [Lentinula lateritia]|uniref:Uncharacterized protein n=1 Tax=Lentinula aff. lateritia TaxID=2804960 RepID=A0ACC1U7K9_9AGAR|nr:hypothetical protein F5876DRAFT_63718 [Lentinula aff. lateritia]KAJ3853089.1 hypothetical protein EV368DRAFT_81911 [Lentinula lateritia]